MKRKSKIHKLSFSRSYRDIADCGAVVGKDNFRRIWCKGINCGNCRRMRKNVKRS